MRVLRIDLLDEFDSGVLSPGERARAARFGSADRRRRWEAGRVGLRRILAEAVGTAPGDIVLTRGERGKPTLEGSDVCFNKTDCGDLALVAICVGREVGIDLEAHRAVLRAERIAARFFSTDEQRRFALAPDPVTVFFDLWTTKEAVLKCDGGGLGAFAMSGFTAPPDLRLGGPVEGRWWVRSVEVEAGFSAAVALSGPEPEELEGIKTRR